MAKVRTWSSKGSGTPGSTMAVVLILTLVCLLAAGTLIKLLGVTGVNVVTRVFGIITMALGVQFVIDGVTKVLG